MLEVCNVVSDFELSHEQTLPLQCSFLETIPQLHLGCVRHNTTLKSKKYELKIIGAGENILKLTVNHFLGNIYNIAGVKSQLIWL